MASGPVNLERISVDLDHNSKAGGQQSQDDSIIPLKMASGPLNLERIFVNLTRHSEAAPLAEAAVALSMPMVWLTTAFPRYAEKVMKLLVPSKIVATPSNDLRFLARLKNGRMADFAAVIDVLVRQRNEDADIWKNIAISVSNAYIRVLDDVRALFGAAFAHDLSWGGDCQSLAGVVLWSSKELRSVIEKEVTERTHLEPSVPEASQGKWSVMADDKTGWSQEQVPFGGQQGDTTPPPFKNYQVKKVERVHRWVLDPKILVTDLFLAQGQGVKDKRGTKVDDNPGGQHFKNTFGTLYRKDEVSGLHWFTPTHVHPRLWCLLAGSKADNEQGTKLADSLAAQVDSLRMENAFLDLWIVQACTDVIGDTRPVTVGRDIISRTRKPGDDIINLFDKSSRQSRDTLGMSNIWRVYGKVKTVEFTSTSLGFTRETKTKFQYQGYLVRPSQNGVMPLMHHEVVSLSIKVFFDDCPVCGEAVEALLLQHPTAGGVKGAFETAALQAVSGALQGRVRADWIRQNLKNTRKEAGVFHFGLKPILLEDAETANKDIDISDISTAGKFFVRLIDGLSHGCPDQVRSTRSFKPPMPIHLREKLCPHALVLQNAAHAGQATIVAEHQDLKDDTLDDKWAAAVGIHVRRLALVERSECERVQLPGPLLKIVPWFGMVAVRYRIGFERILRQINICLGQTHSIGWLRKHVFAGPMGEDYSPDHGQVQRECSEDPGSYVKGRALAAVRLLRKFLIMLGGAGGLMQEVGAKPDHEPLAPDDEEIRLMTAMSAGHEEGAGVPMPLTFLMAADMHLALGVSAVRGQGTTGDGRGLLEVLGQQMFLRGRLWPEVKNLQSRVKELYEVDKYLDSVDLRSELGIPFTITAGLVVEVATTRLYFCEEHRPLITLSPIVGTVIYNSWEPDVTTQSMLCTLGQVRPGEIIFRISRCWGTTNDGAEFTDWKVDTFTRLLFNNLMLFDGNTGWKDIFTGIAGKAIDGGLNGVFTATTLAFAGGSAVLLDRLLPSVRDSGLKMVGSILGLWALVPSASLVAGAFFAYGNLKDLLSNIVNYFKAAQDGGFGAAITVGKKDAAGAGNLGDMKAISWTDSRPFNFRIGLFLGIGTKHRILKKSTGEVEHHKSFYTMLMLASQIACTLNFPGVGAFDVRFQLELLWDTTPIMANLWNRERWKEHQGRIVICKRCVNAGRVFCDMKPVLVWGQHRYNRGYNPEQDEQCAMRQAGQSGQLLCSEQAQPYTDAESCENLKFFGIND